MTMAAATAMNWWMETWWPMGIETGLHGAIAEFLTEQFKSAAARAGPTVDGKRYAYWHSVSPQQLGGTLPAFLMWWFYPLPNGRTMRTREAIIELTDSPPPLVVEVVSDSTVSN